MLTAKNHTRYNTLTDNNIVGVFSMSLSGKLRYDNQRDCWMVDINWQGKRYRLYKYLGHVSCKTEDIGSRLLADIRSDIDKGIFNPKRYKNKSPLHLKQYVPMWLESEKLSWSNATYHDYKNSLYNHILPIIGDKFLPDITYDDIKYLQNNIKRKPKGRKNVLDCLKRLLKTARRAGHISQLPEWIEYKGKNKVVQPPIRYISSTDQLRVVGHIPNEHKPIFLFMMLTGCRPSEARALKKHNIYEDEEYISFEFAFGRGEELKSVKQVTVEPIPITNEIYEVLGMVERNLSPFVFPNPSTGRPYTKNINRIWNKACDDAGVRRIKLYQATRHSFACKYLNAGVDKGIVSKLLRHSDPRMIDRYGRYELEPLRNAMNRTKLFDFGSTLAANKKDT